MIVQDRGEAVGRPTIWSHRGVHHKAVDERVQALGLQVRILARPNDLPYEVSDQLAKLVVYARVERL